MGSDFRIVQIKITFRNLPVDFENIMHNIIYELITEFQKKINEDQENASIIVETSTRFHQNNILPFGLLQRMNIIYKIINTNSNKLSLK